MRKKFRKMLVVCMSAVMVLSMGVVSNAATGSFSNIYVDYPTGNNYTSKIAKTGTTSYATANLTNITTSNHTGHYLKVRKNGTTASETLSFTSTGTKKPSYFSSYAKAGSGYDLYFYSASAVAGMYITGTWTPN